MIRAAWEVNRVKLLFDSHITRDSESEGVNRPMTPASWVTRWKLARIRQKSYLIVI